MHSVMDENSDASNWENENDSDEGSENMISLNGHGVMPGMSPNLRRSLPRSFKYESRKFFLYHAILDQVLSLDDYQTIDWTKIAKTVGYNGCDTVKRTKTLFDETWRVFHGGRTLKRRRTARPSIAIVNSVVPRLPFTRTVTVTAGTPGSITKQVHLLLAMIDELSGKQNRPVGKWTKLASELGYNSESGPRKMFNRLWGKYLKIARPEACIRAKKTTSEKMDEWSAYMQSLDDGDDDEEPLPPYEEYDPRKKSIEDQYGTVDGDGDIEVVTTTIVAD